MKKMVQRMLVTAAAVAITISATAQWSHVPAIYGGASAGDGAVSFTIGNKGYIVAGSTSNDFYMFDTATNGWTNKGPVPVSLGHAFGMGFSLNGKGYVVGGDTSGVPVSTVWRYDPASTTNAWTQLNDFDGGVLDAGIAFVVNDTAYVGTGFDGSGLHNELWRYDAANDNWVQVSNTLPTVLMFSASFVINNRAFIVSGSTTGVNETGQMWEFNTATQSFIPRAACPGVARQAALAFSNNGYGYLGGGMAGYTSNYYDMWRYNPDSNSWSAAGTMPLFGAAWASAFTIGNNAYAGLGAKFAGTSLQGTDSFYKYQMQVPTAISTVKLQHKLGVYPNPVSNLLYIDAPGCKSSELHIYNYIGERVKSVKYKANQSIALDDLAPGYYSLKMQDDEGVFTGSFVKQ